MERYAVIVRPANGRHEGAIGTFDEARDAYRRAAEMLANLASQRVDALVYVRPVPVKHPRERYAATYRHAWN